MHPQNDFDSFSVRPGHDIVLIVFVCTNPNHSSYLFLRKSVFHKNGLIIIDQLLLSMVTISCTSFCQLIGEKSPLVFQIPGGEFFRHFRRMLFTDVTKRVSNRLSQVFAVC